MINLFTDKLFLQILSIILAFSLIIHLMYKAKKTPLLYSFVWLQSLILIWCVGGLIETFAIDIQIKWYSILFQYFSICFIGLSWFLLSLFFSESKLIKNKKLMYLLPLPSVIIFLLVVTNEYHHLFYKNFDYNVKVYGIGFWIHSLISYFYIIVGTIKLVISSFNRKELARQQSFLLTFAITLPVVLNIVHIFKFIDLGVDLTPIGFTFSLLLFALVSFKYKFVNIMPAALRITFDHLDEAILVVDNFNKVLDFNNTYKNIFISGNIDINSSIEDVGEKIIKSIENCENSEVLRKAIIYGTSKQINGELQVVVNKINKCFKLSIIPLFNKNNNLIGRTISLTDVSDYKNLLNELNEKNETLTLANSKLVDYANVVQELTVTKERNRLAKELHDTIGHTMTMLITLMKVSTINLKKNPQEASKNLAEGINIAKSGLQEVRRSISGLLPQKLENNSLISALESLVENSKHLDTEIDLSVEGKEYLNRISHTDIIYRICQESITNSLRHGNAKQIDIILRITPVELKLYIFDNGKGCKKVVKGVGLTSMEERVKSINGNISYGSSGENGFNIHIDMPLNMKSEVI